MNPVRDADASKPPMSEMRRLADDVDLDAVLEAPLLVLYKHSPSCGASRWARTEMERFLDEHPDTPVVLIDVVMQRSLSGRIADALDVRHQSPQVIVVRDGVATWHASHGDVRADLLAEQIG